MMKKIIYRITTVVIIVTHLVTISLRDAGLAQTVSNAEEGHARPVLSGGSVSAGELIGSNAGDGFSRSVISGSQTRMKIGAGEGVSALGGPEKLIRSFHLDPSSGSGIISLPIAVPAGMQGMEPELGLVYGPGNGNGIFGFGWGMELGSIERSTKNGIPKYDETDTFVYSLGGASGELAGIGNNEYRAKIEGAFLRFKFSGEYWEVRDKQGNTYIFGKEDSAKVSNSQGVFKWCLERVKDVSGNYILFSYVIERGQVYPNQIQWTGNEAKQDLPKFSVDFALEERPDILSNFRSGAETTVAKRVKEIAVKVGDSLFKRYELEYHQSKKTGRSILAKVREYASDGVTTAPANSLSYQDNPEPGYTVSSVTGDLTVGDRLWNVRCYGSNSGWSESKIQAKGSYDVGVNYNYNYKVCNHRPFKSCHEESRNENRTVNISWDTDSQGRLKVSCNGINTGISAWTYVYVQQAKRLSLSVNSSGIGEIKYYVNGVEQGSGELELRPGYNLIELQATRFQTEPSQWEEWSIDLTTALADNVDLMNSIQVVIPQLSCDFNGDGLADGGTFFNASGSVKVALSNGSSFLPKQSWIEGFGINQRIVLGDFDGDAKTDICSYDSASGNWQVALSDGNKFVDKGLWLSNFAAGADNQVQTGDFNADGKTDLAVFSRQSGQLNGKITLSKGNRFEVAVGDSLCAVPTDDLVWTGEFNGDGLIDIASFNSSTGAWKFKLNTGRLFAEDGFKDLEGISSFSQNKNIIISDFNSDGLTDIGYYENSTGKIITRLNTGNGFAEAKELPNLEFSLRGQDVQVQSADYNGDGLTDFYAYTAVGNLELALSCGELPDLLRKAENGLGGEIELKYKASTQYDNTGTDEIADLPFPMAVVSQSITKDGQGNAYITDYTYADGYYDTVEREFRGFGYIKVSDGEASYSESWYKQDAVFKGRVSNQEIRDKDGQLYAKTENTWEAKQVYPGVNFPYLSQADNYVYDKTNSRQTRVKFEYNEDGNPTKVFSEGNVSITGDEKTQGIEYTNRTSEGLLSLPKYTYLQDSLGKKVSQKWYYYDNHTSIDQTPEKGRLTKEEAGLFNPLTQIETKIPASYSYDEYGNLVSTTDSLGRTTTTGYDQSYHTYPIEIINSLGQSIQTIYYGVNETGADEIRGSGIFGQVKCRIDLNQQKTWYIYDGLGRISKVVGPYDTEDSPGISYGYDLESRPIKITAKQKTNYSSVFTDYCLLTTYYFYDGLARLIQTKTPAEDDPQTKQKRQIISDTVKFDSRGQVKEKYLPYYVQESADYVRPTYQTPRLSFNYDSLGRVTEVFNPDETVSKTEYYCDKTTNIDENSHSKTSYTDSYGRVIKVEEHNSTEMDTTVYEYDCQGNLTKVRDNQGNITQIWYDSLGRKIKMDDPDMGVWRYEYDAAGNLKQQTDAKSQVLKFEYDGLNRLTKKTVGAGLPCPLSVIYIYDDPAKPNCLGRLSKITDQSGSTEFFYDKLGRETKSIKTVEDSLCAVPLSGLVSYTVQREYDALDRLTKLTYPDAEAVIYEYNPQGIERVASLPGTVLSKARRNAGTWVVSSQPAPVYITNIDYTPTNQIQRIDYGNGTSTEYKYEPDTLRLEQLTTQSPQGKIQDLNYQFDSIGNITEITDHCYTNSQSFVYDDLNRLTQASGSYGVFSYGYDSIGNMINKEGISLSYGKNGRLPHAVTRYGDTQIDYDANGNMTKKANLELIYDAENRLISTVDTTVSAASVPQTAGISLSLNPGWNFISIPVVLKNPKIKAVLASIEGKYDQVSRYNTQTKKFEHYVGSSKYDEFDSFEYGRGYQIYINSSISKSEPIAAPEQQALVMKTKTESTARKSGVVRIKTIAKKFKAFISKVKAKYKLKVNALIPDPAGTKPADVTAYSPAVSYYSVYTVQLSGDLPIKQGISLKAGTNLIFSPKVTAQAVEEALKPLELGKDYSKVTSYNTQAKKMQEYSAAKKEFSKIEPCKAYYLTCIRDATWQISNAPVPVTTTYVYDGDGGRVSKAVSSQQSAISKTTYIGSLYEQENEAGSSKIEVRKKHIFAGSNRICSIQLQSSSLEPRTYYYHSDHLGSSNIITDAAGKLIQHCEYTPYGSIAKSEGTDTVKHKFTGKELDSTGLYYYGARYYDPELGRFTQADTVVQSPYDPQTLNRYSYCRNNPLNYVDPTGHSWKSFWKKHGHWFGLTGSFVNATITGDWNQFGKQALMTMATMFIAVGAAVLSFGILAALTPMVMTANTAMVIGASAAATQITLDTPPGQQLINFVSNEIMDDAFGMRPDAARTWGTAFTYMAVNAGFQAGFGAMMTGGEKVTSKNYTPGKDRALDVEVSKILEQGKGFNYGAAPTKPDNVARVLFNKSGDLVGVTTKSNVLMLGAQHTGIVMNDIPSLSSSVQLKHFPNMSHQYGLWGISHQAVNVSLLEAGYSSTVMSVGGGWTTAVSTVIYGPYGGGATGAAVASQELGKK